MSEKKYKVTINIEDHPPRYCDDWKEKQKISTVHDKFTETIKIYKPPAEKRPVYKSCVTLQVSDKRSKSELIDCAREVFVGENMDHKSTTNPGCRDSSVEGMSELGTLDSMSHSEEAGSWICNHKPLESEGCTYLNIYKLRSSEAATGIAEDKEADLKNINELDDICGQLELRLSGRSSKLKRPGVRLRYLNNISTAKFGVQTQRNGLHVGRQIVIRSSGKNRIKENGAENGGLNILPIMNTNGIGEGFISSDSLAADSVKTRPRLNREGSACSSDSIITEIEGLSDDDHELCESLCGKSDENEPGTEQESAQMTNNWKKIRSMIRWSPFAKNYKKKYPWVQLAGHQGNFKAGEPGTILKKTNDVEKECLIKLMKDVLRPYVPEFKKEVENHEERYLVMQDLLSGFDLPNSVMDCKMGIRTFLEDELEKAGQKPKLRKDLYQKMIDVDPNAPTVEERQAEGITKPRYMKWREELSSSASLGFRIEGIKKANEKPYKDFKTTRSKESVGMIFKDFVNNDVSIQLKYLQRLKAIRGILESSSFFKIHEVIGSSLLFVHDCNGNVNIWLIDFAKTRIVEDGMQINHREKWQQGNHEDGYLFGLDNMISIWSNV